MQSNYPEITSPASKLTPGSTRFLIEPGERPYSVALVKWEGGDSLAIRWDVESKCGYPHSRNGEPQWFILPDDVALSYLSQLLPHPEIPETKRDLVISALVALQKARP